MQCNKCSNNIEEPRANLGLKTCKACAFRGNDVSRIEVLCVSIIRQLLIFKLCHMNVIKIRGNIINHMVLGLQLRISVKIFVHN